MADIKHGTITAGSVTTVTLDKDYRDLEVVNRDGSDAIWFTIDGSTPTEAGDGVHVLPAQISAKRVLSRDSSDPTVVKLLVASGGTDTAFTVEAFD